MGFIANIIGELIDDFEIEIDGRVTISFMTDRIVIDPLISISVMDKKTKKTQYFFKITNASTISWNGINIPIELTLP